MLDAEQEVWRVSRMVHPPSRKRRLTLVLSLEAYLDESGMVAEHDVVVVAGFVAPDFVWAHFAKVWEHFIDKNGLARFHAAPFLARKGEYAAWSNDKWEQAEADIAAIITNLSRDIVGTGTAVLTEAYEKLRLSGRWYLDKDPYYFCLERCLYDLIFRVHGEPADEGVAIYCDMNKQYEQLGRLIAQWHTESLRGMPKPNAWRVDPGRTISTHYVSSIDYKPLQLADIGANGLFRSANEQLKNPAYEATKFLSCFDGMSFRPTFFSTSESIDADIRLRFGEH